jgi:hypothetical protein
MQQCGSVSEVEQDFMAQPIFMKIRTAGKDQEIINLCAVNLMLDESAAPQLLKPTSRIKHDDYSPILRSRKSAIRQRMMKKTDRPKINTRPEASSSWKMVSMLVSPIENTVAMRRP